MDPIWDLVSGKKTNLEELLTSPCGHEALRVSLEATNIW